VDLVLIGAVIIGTVFMLPTMLYLLGMIVAGGEEPVSETQFLIAGKWIEAACAGLFAAWLARRRRIPTIALGLRNRPGQQALWGAATLGGVYVYLVGSSAVILLLLQVAPGLAPDLEHRIDWAQALPTDNLARSILLLIPVAVHEEVLFRALLLTYLRSLTGRWWAAILLSGLIFGALHFDQGVIGAFQIVGLGAVFAIFYWASRSLPAMIAAHFTFNLLQFQLLRVLETLIPASQPASAPFGG